MKNLEIRKNIGNLENLKLEIDNWIIDLTKVNFYHDILCQLLFTNAVNFGSRLILKHVLEPPNIN